MTLPHPQDVQQLTPLSVVAAIDSGLTLFGSMSHTDYHEHSGGVSSTQLKRLLKSPAHFKVPMEDTPSMALGRAVHCAVLEPFDFEKTHVVYEARRAGGAWEAFEAEATLHNRVVMSRKEFDMCCAIRDAVRETDTWHRLAADAPTELAVFAKDWTTGVMRKAKIDLLSPRGVVVDLKTCSDIDSFPRDVNSYGYPFSAAYYKAIAEKVFNVDLDYLWCAVENKPPHRVRFYAPSVARLAVESLRVDEALATYKECSETGIWTDDDEAITVLD